MRRSMVLLLVIGTAGCDEDIESRISLSLEDDVASWPMDLNLATAAEGIDNTITVTVDFEPSPSGLEREMEWEQFQVEYGLENEFAPVLSGSLATTQTEGESIQITVPGANDPQIAWVFERYQGGEFVVPMRIAFAGVFQTTLGVTVFEEFTATFDDYDKSDGPTDPTNTK